MTTANLRIIGDPPTITALISHLNHAPATSGLRVVSFKRGYTAREAGAERAYIEITATTPNTHDTNGTAA